MADKYASMAELERGEAVGRDYRIHVIDRPASPVIILAPHGGSIEIGTSELAALIAATQHSLFAFEGLKPCGTNRDLHITSHRFDHPECLSMTGRHAVVVAVHGCKGHAQIYAGGRDVELTSLLGERLAAAGYPVSLQGHRYRGLNPLNICNRGARGRGAQLEFTNDLRTAQAGARIAPVIRAAIDDYLAKLA